MCRLNVRSRPYLIHREVKRMREAAASSASESL